MSAAAAPSKAAAAAVDAVPVRTGKKKLIIIIGAVLALLLVAGGGAGVYVVKKRAAEAAAAEAEDGGEGDKEAAAHPTVKADLKHAPVFVPLEMFTVNLADREAERYAQIGITLELMDAKAGDLLKAYMPAIRNNILLVLASKQAGQLMEHEGKLQLAAEIRAAALKPLGYTIDLPQPAVAASAAGDAEAGQGDAKPKKKARPAPEDPDIPVRAVHFSNFIIQ